MSLPTALHDRPMRALALYLMVTLNDRIWAIFDEAGEPRQDAIREAVIGRPDLLTSKTFPLLSVATPTITNGSRGQWRGEIQWVCAVSTVSQSDQQDWMRFICKALIDALLDYNAEAQPCILIDEESPITGFCDYSTIFRGNSSSAISFPRVLLNFDFTDLEAV